VKGKQYDQRRENKQDIKLFLKENKKRKIKMKKITVPEFEVRSSFTTKDTENKKFRGKSSFILICRSSRLATRWIFSFLWKR